MTLTAVIRRTYATQDKRMAEARLSDGRIVAIAVPPDVEEGERVKVRRLGGQWELVR